MSVSFSPGLWELLLRPLFPARCLGCGRVIGPEEFFCRQCGEPKAPGIREIKLPGYGRGIVMAAPLYYREGFRKTLQAYKFKGRRGLGRPLGRLMARHAAASFSQTFDGVTFVPLSKAGLRRRGYDQSRLLAKSAARALGLPLLPLLVKVRETETQHLLGRQERLKNVKGAYGALPKAQGLRLLLVDDIATTGATLAQCAQALYRARAREVCGLCAASAQKRDG